MAKTAKKAKPERRAIALGATAMTVLDHDSAQDPVVIAKGFRITANGLMTVEGSPTIETCEHVGVSLRVIERGAQFAIGDFVNYVEERFGEDAAQIIDAGSGWSEKTIAVYRWVAERITRDRRRMDRLGIRHHLLVASMTAAKQREWLTKAANDDGEPWTVKELADALDSSGDAEAQAWWVLVACASAVEQSVLMNNLESQGKTVKALVRKGKKA